MCSIDRPSSSPRGSRTWTGRSDDTTGVAELVCETLRPGPHVYLVPAYEDAESEDAVLEDYWPHLFEALLAGG